VLQRPKAVFDIWFNSYFYLKVQQNAQNGDKPLGATAINVVSN